MVLKYCVCFIAKSYISKSISLMSAQEPLRCAQREEVGGTEARCFTDYILFVEPGSETKV